MMDARAQHAHALFAGIAAEYEWMGAVLSFGQDGRWRRAMVSALAPQPGQLVLDVASGTGLVARRIGALGGNVIQLDSSEAMLRAGRPPSRAAGLDAVLHPVLGRAEQLPFEDDTFDAVSFTYLFRYVNDPAATMKELVRVLRPGGRIACLEFHEPRARSLRAGWAAYTRYVMPLIGGLVSPQWRATARFLGPNISRFYADHPMAEQARWWKDAGLRRVRSKVMSLGVGVVWCGERDA
jgi:demethylmenaquinone methyltransferase/2-methoxy-6-polyprenyl-1,4-benzoquinol methylase